MDTFSLAKFGVVVKRCFRQAESRSVSAPTTQYIVALCKLFHVSADSILGTESRLTVTLDDYTEEEANLIFDLLHYFDKQHK